MTIRTIHGVMIGIALMGSSLSATSQATSLTRPFNKNEVPIIISEHPQPPIPYLDGEAAIVGVDAALERAKQNGKNVAIIIGLNACHDTRALMAWYGKVENRTWLDDQYEVVLVESGRQKERNLAIPQRFGVQALEGTPTTLIVMPDGTLLNRKAISKTRTVASWSDKKIRKYFSRYAPDNLGDR